MANYTTSFSCLFPVGAGNVDAALTLYKQMEADCVTDHNEIGFEAQRDSDDHASLWLYSDDSRGDPEQVIAYVLQCAEALNLSGFWGFRWGLGCDKPRLDAYGGGAQVLDLGRRESAGWIDCEHWLAQWTGAGGLHAVMAETILEPVAVAEGWTPATQVCVLLGFIDKLIGANPSVAGQLRADLAEVAAVVEETECSECGKPMFVADSGTSHHVGDGPDGIDHSRDRDHTAIAETAVSPSSGPDYPDILRVQAPANPKTRVGRWYALGPADRRFVPGDPAFGIYRIVADDAGVPGCVTVEGPGGHRFPLHVALADDIAGPSVAEGGLSPDCPGAHGEQRS